jgi:hypothetical protein
VRVSPEVFSYVGFAACSSSLPLVDTREEVSYHYMGTLGAVRQFPLACISRQSGIASAPTIPRRVQTSVRLGSCRCGHALC